MTCLQCFKVGFQPNKGARFCLARIGSIDAIGTDIEFEGKDVLKGRKWKFVPFACIPQIDAKDFLPLGDQDKVGFFRNGQSALFDSSQTKVRSE